MICEYIIKKRHDLFPEEIFLFPYGFIRIPSTSLHSGKDAKELLVSIGVGGGPEEYHNGFAIITVNKLTGNYMGSS